MRHLKELDLTNDEERLVRYWCLLDRRRKLTTFRNISKPAVFRWFVDETRLVEQWRLLDERRQVRTFCKISEEAFNRWLPDDYNIMNCVPRWDRNPPEKFVKCGIEHWSFDFDFVAEIIHNGITETGDPLEVLLCMHPWHECICNFEAAVNETQLRFGEFIWTNVDKEFAEDFVAAWQRELLYACERAKEKSEEAGSLIAKVSRLFTLRRVDK